MIKIERVLVPVDGSVSSKNAAIYAAHLVNSRNPRIYLLNVWKPIVMTIGGKGAERLRQEEQIQAMAKLEEYRMLLKPFGMEIELVARSGQPGFAILDVQEEYDCDLIVIGSRGLSALENVIMGSVVNRVLQGAACPVLVTRNLRARYLQDAIMG